MALPFPRVSDPSAGTAARGVRWLLAGLLGAAAACTDASGAASRTLFHDDFNHENGMVARADYRAFRQWEVVDGSADLEGAYPFEFLEPGHGMYVDLDGSHLHAATLRSRVPVALEPGTYLLSFRLAGSQHVSAPDTLWVSLGGLYRERFVVGPTSPMLRYVRTVRVRRATSAHLQFAHQGGDNVGMLLDDVDLSAAPAGRR